MSQPAGQSKVARPRRASRAPVRLGDENSVVSTSAAAGHNPRLIGKTSTASLAAAGRLVGGQKPTVSVSTAGGAVAGGSKISVGVAPAPAVSRRALGDVSNANSRISIASDRTSKDSLNAIVKPTAGAGRSRTTTASSSTSQQQQPLQPPSSTGTGLSRLKIGSSSVVPAAKASRGASRVPSSNLLAPPNVKGPGTSLRGAEWGGAVVQDEAEMEFLRDQQQQGATVGLGIGGEGRDDWVGDKMAREQQAYLPSSSAFTSPSLAASHKRGHLDVEEEEEEVDSDEDDGVGSKVRIVDPAVMADPEDWVNNVEEEDEVENERILEEIKQEFDEQLDYWDTTMVAEYSEEIFEYMGELEEAAMPNPRYMDHQSEIEWPMRTTLIDWLLQVHMRYHMLPETLWIAINIVDRFLSNRVVSLVKFQLVGVTAMFVAAKYEEIMAPSVDEFVFMTEGGYTRDEILKGERIILQSLEFNISPYCSPYSWVRRISKADDYDIQTRTLSKFLMEVTLLDHRFLRAKPSMIAAIGMYLARRMLGGEWNESFIYYSNYTEAQLLVPSGFLLESIVAADFDQKFVYKKYANKKFLKASIFARNWARQNAAENVA